MRIVIDNWLLKAEKEDDKTITVKIIANSLGVDKEGQRILPQAFNEATIKNFLDFGVIDYHHKSVTGHSAQEKSEAIIGKPIAFLWENGLPVVHARLTKSHPIVKTILPHLEADQPVYGGSVGGSIKKAKKSYKENGKSVDDIYEIDWTHLAIAGAPYVISSGSNVSLIKAAGSGKVGEEEEIQVTFSNIHSFTSNIKSYIDRESELIKALTVGAGTDSANLTGVDALRSQSLEGGLQADIINDVLEGIDSKQIRPTLIGVEEYLQKRGISAENSSTLAASLKKEINIKYQNLIKSKQEDNFMFDEDKNEDIEELQNLIKASDGADDDDDDDDDDEKKGYNAEYMKKYFKRYMKENKDDVEEYAGQLGMLKKAMSQAVDDVEMSGADATLVDGTEMFKAFVDIVNTLADSQQVIYEKLADLESHVAYNTELSKASGNVLIKAAETLEGNYSEPNKVKGAVSATQLPVGGQGQPMGSMGGNSNLLSKAQSIGVNEIKHKLLKAAEAGQAEAISVMTQIESCFGNLSKLPQKSLQFINNLE